MSKVYCYCILSEDTYRESTPLCESSCMGTAALQLVVAQQDEHAQGNYEPVARLVG